VFLGEQEGFLALQERPSENPGVNLGGGVRGVQRKGREGGRKGCEVEVGLIASTSSSLCRNSHIRIIY